MYLNHDEIEQLIKDGYMQNVDPSCINAASLDLRLGNSIMTEKEGAWHPDGGEIPRLIDYQKREKMGMKEVTLGEGGIILSPGEVILAHSVEVCNFPDNLAALFRIKSSMGRIFLEHMDAGWVDPGFNGTLTLEFKNMSQHHSILLRPGDKIGQLVFFRGNTVSEDKSYRARGNYNGAKGPKQVGYKEECND